MPTFYDIAWRGVLAGVAVASGFAPKLRRKARRALTERVGLDVPAAPPDAGSCVLIHAVSLGEMNATRALVARLGQARQDLRFLVTVTTDTGYARGRELYGADPRVTLCRFPLDLSVFIHRLLDRQRPAVAVLMELEVWPNFTLLCEREGIPVVLINGRLTESSYRGYRRALPVVRPMFRRLSVCCVQDEAYAERFRGLGVRPDVVRVTGTMKFDTADVADSVAGAEALAADVGLQSNGGPVWVCGSTGPGEEKIVLEVYRRLLKSHPTLRLVIVPRHPERFDAVAGLIEQTGFRLVRRSASRDRPLPGNDAPAVGTSIGSPVVLGDTMGELRRFYALADVVLVGRTLVDLGPRQRGSDMIEPAALGRPVIVGPWTHNFADAMRLLKLADGVVETTADRLVDAVRALLDEPGDVGRRAQEVVRRQRGATERHADVILDALHVAG